MARPVRRDSTPGPHRRRTTQPEGAGWPTQEVLHDMKNLLTIVMAHARLVHDDPKASDAVRMAMGRVDEAAHRAAELIRQLAKLIGRSR
jgi:hypothetical protein